MFLSLFPHIWILQAFFMTTIVSSEKDNFFQSSFVQFLFSWQKSIRVFLLAGLIKLFSLNTLFSEAISSPVISNSNLRKFLSSVMVKLWADVLFLFDFTRRNRRLVSSIVRRGFLLLNLMFHTVFLELFNYWLDNGMANWQVSDSFPLTVPCLAQLYYTAPRMEDNFRRFTTTQIKRFIIQKAKSKHWNDLHVR